MVERNPEIKELEPTLLPPASKTGASTTLDSPIKDADKRAVAAAVARDVEKKPFERFEDALRQVLSVPKSVLDERVKRENEGRKRKN